MKKLLAMLLCVLLLAGCTAPAVYDGPTNSVWVLTERITETYDTYTGETFTDRSAFSYDAFGNQVRILNYDEGELSTEYRREYDAHGNQTSNKIWDHDGLIPWIFSSTDYLYDEQDRPLATIYRNLLGLERRRDTYTYDDEARTVLWEGRYDTQTTWLDENGRILRSLTLSDPSGISIETIYEYDELGRRIRVLSCYDSILSSTMELHYDEQDRLTEEIYFDADGSVYSRTTYHYTENAVTSYDLDGRKTVETLRPDGQVEKQEQFDKTGKLLMSTRYIYQEIQVPVKGEE